MKKKLLLLTGIATVMLSSCVFDVAIEHAQPSPSTPTNKTEVKFSSSILTQNSTYSRTIGNYWEAGDAIGTYMIEKGSSSVVERRSNIRFITEKSGYICNFIASDDFIYFPEDGRNVRFMSYYPYNESIIDAIYKIDVSKQFPQSKIDFLYSFNTSAVYNKNIEIEKIPMTFNHQLTKIFINVKNGHGLQGFDLMNMKVSLSGLSTHADFDLFTGKTSNFTKSSPIYPSVLIAGGGNVYSAEAILIPEPDMSNAKIVFEMNNGNKNKKSDVYIWNLAKALEKGKRYTYNVTVYSTGISVSTTIQNWHNINIEEEISLE